MRPLSVRVTWLAVLLAAAAILALLLLQNRASMARHHAVPHGLEVAAHVVGFPDDVRFFPRDTVGIERMAKEFADSWAREKAYLHRQDLPATSYLAASGGGDNGAFTAGFLNAWTKAGTRPQFKLVTGVSTGALIAPFAFLGPDYDEALKSMYTNVSRKDILRDRIFYSGFFKDAMADTTPLWKLLRVKVTQKMIDAIGAEYPKGRMLFLATTNLDARRPVVWNITKIAASGQPGALDLIRKIMLASTAIPGAFPPVMFDVEANGKSYQEMHVDGGASAQVFVYWTGVQVKKLSEEHGAQRERAVYVLCNARLDPEWAEVERRTLPITFSAIQTLIEYHVIGDLYRIYEVTKRDGTDFNLAYIPEAFKVPHTKEFDTAYMQQLYEFGFAQARDGYRWAKQPPTMVGEFEKDASQ
jgi:predicted patatin/cPLA2 family phospholipase